MIGPVFRAAALALLVPALQDPPAPKEPPKATVKESGDFRLLVKELELKFGGRIRFTGKIASKDVSVSVADASFYEALDALCRAHQEATYYEPDVDDWTPREQSPIRPGTWVDYPSCYSGHFKVAVVALAREARSGPDGDAQRAMASLVLFAPPWLSVTWPSGARTDWTVEEAKDSGGRDVL